MKILYLSPDMSAYGSAGYQHDVMQELAQQAEVSFYGPGFPAYHAGDSLADAVAKAGFAPDWIVCGHAWLEDRPGAAVNKFAHIDLTRTDVPRAAILNKEYTNLAAKLEWMRGAGMSVILTHHHDAAGHERRSGVRTVFWPFAADHRLFHDRDGKTLDLGFSGILQNPTPGNQSDLRVRVMQRLFECDGDLPVRLREWCRDLRVKFNALPRSEAQRALAEQSGLYRRMGTGEYAAFVRSCRAFLCTRSPADLVSPRYFECMLSGTLVIAERSAAHAAIFPEGCLLEFGDEAEIQGRLLEAMEGAEAIVERAQREAAARHTWEKRVASLLAELSSCRATAAA